MTELALFSSSTTPQETTSNLYQQKIRFSCLSSAKDYFDTFLSISPVKYIGLTLPLHSQSVRSLGSLLYLCTLDEPGWSKDAARAEVNILRIIDTYISQMEETVAHHRLEEDDTLSRHCHLDRSLRPSWAAMLADGESVDNGETSHKNAVAPAPIGLDDATLGDLFDLSFFDNEWLPSWPSTNTF